MSVRWIRVHRPALPGLHQLDRVLRVLPERLPVSVVHQSRGYGRKLRPEQRRRCLVLIASGLAPASPTTDRAVAQAATAGPGLLKATTAWVTQCEGGCV